MSSSEAEILNELNNWFSAIASEDPDKVVLLYSRDAILQSTLQSQPKKVHVDIFHYFAAKLLPMKPRGIRNSHNVRIFDEMAINTGLYDFDIDLSPCPQNGKAERGIVEARYTFVYRKISDNNWIIVEHHSSS
ncbi:MAG: hypothetical protein Q8M72_07810, partial [Methylocystis sp.]|nr:hypothetical protein [Methylocystis sp.]